MGKIEDYESILDQLAAIGDDEIQTPHNVPVYAFISEADLLHKWVQKDKDQLIAAGLDWALVEHLPVRSRALTEAEARWSVNRKTVHPWQEEWQTLAPRGIELRKTLLHCFRFAFRNQKGPMEILKHVTKGRGYADLIQDLNQLVFLAKEREAPLTAINFDFSLLEQAEETAQRMTKLYAEVTGKRKEQNETLLIRNQVYTLLKQAVDEIRHVGRFVFHQNKHRLAGYRSQHMQRASARRKERAKTPKPAKDNSPQE